jgi:glycosyltransferase involved in cell wall biosynthesis
MSDLSKEKKLKVAMLGAKGYPYVYGGYDTLMKEMGERLNRKGVEVRIYCHSSLFPVKPPVVNGIKLVYIPGIETKSLSQLSHSLFSILHACLSDVDVIFVVNSANGPFGFLTKFFRKPTAINVDGLEWLRPKWKGFGAKYFLWASKLATKLYDRVITDSVEMQKIYLDLFDAPSTVIAYGANPAHESNPERIRNWGLEPKGYYLIVGRLVPDNNADLIIKGFVQSKTKSKLVIVGDIPYTDAYVDELKAIKDDRLLFTGYITDPEELTALYHQSFAYFHGHEYGGTNPAMLKALGYGCAILALNTRFNQEMLQNGKHGWYFEKSHASVLEIIDRAERSTEDLDMLRSTSRDGLTQKYNWDYVTEQYLEVFKSLKK